MAFKMKNPSMAKLTKAAGDNRVAMKMKKESAAKMKKEAAMKMKKESMAKLMDKASAMKLKKDDAAMKLKKDSPVKADIPEVTVTDKKPLALNYNVPIIAGRRHKKVEGGFVAVEGGRKEFIADSQVEKAGRVKYRAILPDGSLSVKYTTRPGRTGGTATKMKKESSMKMGHKSAAKLKKPSPAKQKMNMVKGPDGKMVPDFAVDGKGANDMKSGAKMKKPMKMKKESSMKLKDKATERAEKRANRSNARKLKRAEKKNEFQVSYIPGKKVKRKKLKEMKSEIKKYKKGGSVKDACYHKVKAGEKVFPSAYASGRIAKCRKVGAANYGKGKKK